MRLNSLPLLMWLLLLPMWKVVQVICIYIILNHFTKACTIFMEQEEEWQLRVFKYSKVVGILCLSITYYLKRGDWLCYLAIELYLSCCFNLKTTVHTNTWFSEKAYVQRIEFYERMRNLKSWQFWIMGRHNTKKCNDFPCIRKQ